VRNARCSRVNPAGIAERVALLEQWGYEPGFLERQLPTGVGRDDLIDAAALALIAVRIANGQGVRFPRSPARDSKGLQVAIWS
jgi:predicted RNase H-like nuclease